MSQIVEVHIFISLEHVCLPRDSCIYLRTSLYLLNQHDTHGSNICSLHFTPQKEVVLLLLLVHLFLYPLVPAAGFSLRCFLSYQNQQHYAASERPAPSGPSILRGLISAVQVTCQESLGHNYHQVTPQGVNSGSTGAFHKLPNSNRPNLFSWVIRPTRKMRQKQNPGCTEFLRSRLLIKTGSQDSIPQYYFILWLRQEARVF